MFTLLVFLIVLSVIVLAHEWGHFISARKSGMAVHEFGLGFPPRAIGWYKDPQTQKWVKVNGKFDRTQAPSTIYSLNWLPLGGFVSIKGEEGEDTSPDSFISQGFWKKVITVVAGVLMNVVLASALLSIGYMVGLPQMADNLPASAVVGDRRLEIVQVFDNKPASEAGIVSGDVIIGVGDLDVPTLGEMQNYINENKDNEVLIKIQREGETIEKNIKPMVYEDTGKGGIGVALADIGTVKYPFFKAIYHGVEATGYYLKAIVIAFYSLIMGLFTGNAGMLGEAAAGPVGIAVLTGQMARLGLGYLLQFTALLSLNLAILNILPIPALDGGRLVFLVIGKIIKNLLV